MSNRRKLRPHETARRDQCLAEAKARLRRGGVVSWVDLADPGKQCSYCDCPITPDSPHWRRGYVCGRPCPAGAVYVVTMACHSPALLSTFPVCGRHCEAQLADLRELLAGRMPVEVLPGWLDPDNGMGAP